MILFRLEYTERFWCLNVVKKGSSLRTALLDCRQHKTTWDIQPDRTIRLSSDKCLEKKGTSSLGDPSLRIEKCNGSPTQQFTVTGDQGKLTVEQGGLYLTSQHHPSEGEGVQMSTFADAKRHRILYWKCF